MLNKQALMRAASKTTGLSLRDTAACIDSIIETIASAISRGERVELRGLGSFDVRTTAARKTVFTNVPAHGRVVFRPSQKLRESAWKFSGSKNKSS
jgi:nucleoid DNA-binding protein